MWYGSSFKNGYGGESFTVRKARKSRNGGLGWWITIAVIFWLFFGSHIPTIF
ncbi:hypothetical protein Erwinia_phage_Aioli_00074 [Erwinia phage Aioli]|nr:hypothetical protein Erwinia_phage_Aioli_00074 [Erwinia phage Aioli]